MQTSDFHYELPEKYIAQRPPKQRGTSNMLVLDRKTGNCEISKFKNFVSFLKKGDCLVLNNTKVINARFYGKKNTGANIEILLTMPLNNEATIWKSFIKPGKRVKVGTVIELKPNDKKNQIKKAEIVVTKKNNDGTYEITFKSSNIEEIEKEFGHTPLPPYIKRDDDSDDSIRYQTLFAKEVGAVAAPTAGLHFTDEIFKEIDKKGINIAEVTLHVGPGTFQPVTVENPAEHIMHSEIYSLTSKNAEIINKTKENGGRIVAIGTTSVRVLETCATTINRVKPSSGVTDIFLYPPMKPKITDILLTNFHLPQSTLLMLVSIFADKDSVLNAYEIAKEANFKFYSYGDCMLLL